MKKIFISAGLVAAGAAGLQNVCAAGLDVISPKAWNVSGTLRGFYDDNYSVSSTKQGSFGIEASPEISFNVPLQQTDLGIRYIYGLYYYQQRQDLGLNAIDQTHQLDIWFDHSFNERWKLKVTDSLAVGQEPALLGPVSPAAPNGVPIRVEGNNFANHALVTLNTDWTRLFSTSLAYGNDFYDYEQSGAGVGPIPSPGLFYPTGATLPPISSHAGIPGPLGLTGAGASLAGLLNRVEQNVSLDLQWHVQPETMIFVGYQFALVNYTGNEQIGVANLIGGYTPAFGLVGNPPVVTAGSTPTYKSVIYRSDSRDSMTHSGHVGVQHEFTANLSGKASAGVSYTDSYNDPLQSSSSLSPNADINISYTYIPGSYVQLGFTHSINATDIASVDASGNLTQYQESSVLYADINHRFTPKLLGTVVGRYQYSTYQVGGNSGSTIGGDTSYSLSLNLNYQINNHFSVEAGYNFDELVSGINNRAYDRNRVYLGLGANY